MLFGNILCLYPLGKLIRDGKLNRTLFYHSGNDFFRQMFLRRQRLGTSGLGDIIGFGNGISFSFGAVLFFIFLIRKEGISLFAGTDRPSRFLSFIKGTGVSNLLVLSIEKKKVTGALRGTLCHKA